MSRETKVGATFFEILEQAWQLPFCLDAQKYILHFRDQIFCVSSLRALQFTPRRELVFRKQMTKKAKEIPNFEIDLAGRICEIESRRE